MKNKIMQYLTDFSVCAAGCILYSIGINVFAIPNDLVQGGVTGIALILHRLFPFISVGSVTMLLNIPLFILAFKFIGKIFTVKSFAVTLIMSVSLDIFSCLPGYRGDGIISVLFGGALCGISLALIFMRDTTTGGTDIAARLIRLKAPHLSMGRLILFFDLCVTVIAALVFRKIETALYSAVMIFVSTYFIDYIIYGAFRAKTLMIVTKKYEDISRKITTVMKRGVTVIPVEGGYTGEKKKMLICALRSSEAARLNKIIKETDNDAFTIVCDAGEIVGLGFKNPEE